MKKNLKKIYLSSMIFVLIFSLTPFPSLALERLEFEHSTVTRAAYELPYNIRILVDNELEFTVEERTGTGSIVSTNNRQTNMLTISFYDFENNLVYLESLDLSSQGTFNASQNTFSNREYSMQTSFWTPGSSQDPYWTIRSGNSRRSGLESTVNRHSDLMSFRSAVDRVNSAEWALIGVIGGTSIVTVVAALLTAGTGAAIAATGGVAGAATAIAVLNNAINDADFYFSRIFFW